jgi:hypothetical protein
MGSEVDARLVHGKRRVPGRALFETDEILFRGTPRVRVALRDVREARAEGDALVLRLADETVTLEIGARHAARWAEKIRTPPTRLSKLGIGPGVKVALVGAFAESDTREVLGVATKATPGAAGVTLLGAATKKELARVAALRGKMRHDAALWVVYPKGVTVIREADVIGAGRDAGLKDVKVVRFSETHTALKFVVPLAERRP